MNYIHSINGKETKFTFKNKKQKQEYIDNCELTWGCVPYDVNWAINTNIYKETVNEMKVLFYKTKDKIADAIDEKCTKLIILNNIQHYIHTHKHLRPFTYKESKFIIRNNI